MEMGAVAPTPRVAPKLDPVAKAAEEAASAARQADWGPVFVYGSMTLPQTWDALIGRMPDMRAAKLRGHARRTVGCGGFAALIEMRGKIVLGQLVCGLRPSERRLLDRVVDDGFELVSATVRCLDDLDEDIECTTYIWREEFEDALEGDEDWDLERYSDECLEEFVALCSDMRESQKAESLSDEELKALTMSSRRRRSGVAGGGDDED